MTINDIKYIELYHHMKIAPYKFSDFDIDVKCQFLNDLNIVCYDFEIIFCNTFCILSTNNLTKFKKNQDEYLSYHIFQYP